MTNMPLQTASQDTGTAAPYSLLFVDDEANILSALKRLFRPHGYRIWTAGGGQEGLDILAREPIDLVISDMRMPEMNGAQFLEKVREQWPDTVRILLTGYAEISATIDAINRGQIYRYVSKPWEDNDIVLLVKQALERKALEREKLRLEALTQRQNDELKELNATLEEKVRVRTEEVRQTMAFLEKAHEQLKKGFTTSIRVLSSLIEMRGGHMAGHSRKVADTARKLAIRLKMPAAEVQDVVFAALLHDIGKIGLPDKVLERPFSVLTNEEREEVVKHPIKGQMALMELEQLQGAAAIIRSHHERFDGQGYPDKLSGINIPRGARLLAVVNDYDALQNGSLTTVPMREPEARAYIKESRGTRYDPTVVDAFLDMLGELSARREAEEGIPVRPAGLKAGMVIARDVLTSDGILLLSKGYVLTDAIIAQIYNYEKAEGRPITVYVQPKGE